MPLDLPDVRLAGIAPEIALCVTALLLLIIDAVVPDRASRWYLSAAATVGLGVSIFLAIQAWGDSELQLAGMVAVLVLSSQATPDWRAVEEETMRHYQALLRLDTSNPPGNETTAARYLKEVFDREGIPAQIVASDPSRANVIARLKGSGRKKPLLIMGHTDVVTVDPAKWKFPPFSGEAGSCCQCPYTFL